MVRALKTQIEGTPVIWKKIPENTGFYGLLPYSNPKNACSDSLLFFRNRICLTNLMKAGKPLN